MAAEITRREERYENAEAFLIVTWKYTSINEITCYILNELIEKIVEEDEARISRLTFTTNSSDVSTEDGSLPVTVCCRNI